MSQQLGNSYQTVRFFSLLLNMSIFDLAVKTEHSGQTRDNKNKERRKLTGTPAKQDSICCPQPAHVHF
jgi:hypothetical protein